MISFRLFVCLFLLLLPPLFVGCGPSKYLVDAQVRLELERLDTQKEQFKALQSIAQTPQQTVRFPGGGEYTVWRQMPSVQAVSTLDLSRLSEASRWKETAVHALSYITAATIPSVFSYLAAKKQASVEKVRITANRDVDLAQWETFAQGFEQTPAILMPGGDTITNDYSDLFQVGGDYSWRTGNDDKSSQDSFLWREDNSVSDSNNPVTTTDNSDHSDNSIYTESPVVPIAPVFYPPQTE